MIGIHRRQFMWGAAAWGLALLLPVWAVAGENVDPKPNIIFIMVDDMGYHDLGCYGSEKILTPNIDKMCAEGIKFTDCYSGSVSMLCRAMARRSSRSSNV